MLMAHAGAGAVLQTKSSGLLVDPGAPVEASARCTLLWLYASVLHVPAWCVDKPNLSLQAHSCWWRRVDRGGGWTGDVLWWGDPTTLQQYSSSSTSACSKPCSNRQCSCL